MFEIITDSSCDLHINIVEKHNIKVVPMHVTIDNQTYKHYADYRELSNDDFYKLIAEGHVGTTAAANIEDIADEMRRAASNGSDIIYISLSSAVSCSYQNATIAANMVVDDYENINITVVDSKSASVGVGLLAYTAAIMREADMLYSDVVLAIQDLTNSIKVNFFVDDLKNLQKSGRISHMSASIGSVLNIKPILSFDTNGKIQAVNKMRGRKASIKYLTTATIEKCKGTKFIGISHANATEEANTIKEALVEVFPDADILVSNIGPILGNHTGEKAIAVAAIAN